MSNDAEKIKALSEYFDVPESTIDNSLSPNLFRVGYYGYYEVYTDSELLDAYQYYMEYNYEDMDESEFELFFDVSLLDYIDFKRLAKDVSTKEGFDLLADNGGEINIGQFHAFKKAI